MRRHTVPEPPARNHATCMMAALAAMSGMAALFAPAAFAAPAIVPANAGADGFGSFLSAGVRYILPGGNEQILFLLAIFLASPRTGPLLTQVLAFMLGHTLTLWLAVFGIIVPPAGLIAWLVPATIVLASLENLLFGRVTKMKPGLVFFYGLIHGLAFALAFQALGPDNGQRASELLAFNLGLEVSHLAIIGLAFAASLYFRGVLKQSSRMDLFRPMIVVPVSLAICVTGLVWTVQAFPA